MSIFKKTYVQARLTLLFFGFFLLLITFIQIGNIYENGIALVKKETAQMELKRLLLLTIQHVKNNAVPSSRNIWSELKISKPLLDPWGTRYHFMSEKGFMVWRSAGVDLIFYSDDDIFFRIPYNSNGLVDALPTLPLSDSSPASTAQ